MGPRICHRRGPSERALESAEQGRSLWTSSDFTDVRLRPRSLVAWSQHSYRSSGPPKDSVYLDAKTDRSHFSGSQPSAVGNSGTLGSPSDSGCQSVRSGHRLSGPEMGRGARSRSSTSNSRSSLIGHRNQRTRPRHHDWDPVASDW